MIVTEENFDSVTASLLSHMELAVDLETTGLYPWKGDRIFGMAFATEKAEYYFPFSLAGDTDLVPYMKHLEYVSLPRGWMKKLAPLFADAKRSWINHNIQFDMNFFRQEGMPLAGKVYCTMTMARIEYNDHMRYGLNDCAEREFGDGKDDAVKDYMVKNKLFELISIPGKKTRIKNYFFHRVPLDIIGPYACKDARLAFDLKRRQSETFAGYDAVGTKPITPVVELEQETTRVLHELQHTGIRIDRDYCQRAIAHESSRIAQAERAFTNLAGVPLLDSAKGLKPVFERFGVEAGKTAKGNDSFTSDVLRKHRDTPIVGALLAHRDAKKRLGTYFSAFDFHSAGDGCIHSNIAPIAATARFTSRDPNLQNLSDEETEEAKAKERGELFYPVRRAFVPRPGALLFSFDWKAMEYYMMLDQACQLLGRESPLLLDIRDNDTDVHQATANVGSQVGVEIERFEAKISNFLTIYGGGTALLAEKLHCSIERATAIREAIFNGAPEIKLFMRRATKVAEQRGYVFNWLGRRYHFPDSNFAYKAPNYLIQGGCSEVMRLVLVQVNRLLQGCDSKLLLTIHDELILDIYPHELWLVPRIKEIMETAYPAKYLPLRANVAYSETSLGDLKDWSGDLVMDVVAADTGRFALVTQA